MKRTGKFSLGNENEHDYTWRYGKFSLKQIDSEVEKESFLIGKSFITQTHHLRVSWKALEVCQQAAPFVHTRQVTEFDEEQQEHTEVWKTSSRHERNSSIDTPQSSLRYYFPFQHLRFMVTCKEHKSLFQEFLFNSLFSSGNLNQIFMGP